MGQAADKLAAVPTAVKVLRGQRIVSMFAPLREFCKCCKRSE
jgi:hypothetical protein